MLFVCGVCTFGEQINSNCKFLMNRRVHITSETLEHLNEAYKVEDGDGQERDPYLKEHGVVTYLVINPKVLKTS